VLTRLSDKDKMTVKTKFILGIFKNSDTTWKKTQRDSIKMINSLKLFKKIIPAYSKII
jgi:hypothetical protein